MTVALFDQAIAFDSPDWGFDGTGLAIGTLPATATVTVAPALLAATVAALPPTLAATVAAQPRPLTAEVTLA